MKIYDATDSLLLDIEVDDNSYRNRTIMGDHNLTLYYSLAAHVEIPVGAYCEFEGERYTLLRPEHIKVKHQRHYDYTVTFSSDQDKSKIWNFRNPVDGRLKFPLTAKPKEHLQMVVDNMNRHDTGWSVGTCIEDVEKLISYDHDYCWDALSKMASKFKTEFEIVGKRISLCKVEYNKSNPLPLSYGKGQGFKSGIGRSNSGDKLPTEILFVQGGDRNIDRSKYPSSTLLLPKGQTIAYDGEHFEDEIGFNPDSARHYSVDDLGFSIYNVDKMTSTGAEDSLDRSDDYPKRVGTISRVDEVDKDKHFYDFIDDSIPPELNYEDYLIGEESMTVIFQSGELAGREFDVKYYHDPKTINGKGRVGRRFEIVPQEIDGVMMPGGSFVPKAGNTYAIFNVMLPDNYIRNDPDKSGASWDMFRAAVKYLFDNEQMKYTFTGELDGLWAKKNWIDVGGKIYLGAFVLFTNEQFEQDEVLIRIVGIKDSINNPHSPKIELSNETVSGSVSSTINQLESTEVVIDESFRNALQYTKRRFRDAKETMEMLEKAMLDEFSPTINPVAIQTMSMLVGDESLQYVFTRNLSSDEVVPHSVVYDREQKKLSVGTSYIKHMTINITSIKQSHLNNEYRRWTVGEYTSPALSEPNKSYYLYAKVSDSGNTGTFTLEETAKSMESGDGFYFLLVGILNSEYNGERSFATLYGFTEVLPGQITTDQIVSNDGQTYFNLLLGEIGGKIKFKAGTSGLEYVEGYDTLTDSIQAAKDAADSAKQDVDNLNTYVDNAFRDGIVTEDEARTIKAYINVINNTKLSVEASYAQLYTNALLTGTPKYDLEAKYDTLLATITNLINGINDAIADGKATAEESLNVDALYDRFNAAYATYQKAVEIALDSILDAINNKAEDAQDSASQAVADATEAKETASAAQTSADNASSSVTDLNNYVDGAFKDGIFDHTEIETIRSYIKVATTQKEAANSACDKLYTNVYLLKEDGSDSAEKTNLAAKRDAYNTAFTNLIDGIYSTIEDGKATDIERVKLDKYFKLYSSAYAQLSTAIEDAYDFIYSRILTTADASAKEDVARLGETIIEGGYIRTNLINVDELIARHVIAGIDGGQRIELNPDTKRILVVSEDGTTTIFEGNQYATPLTSLFGGTGGTLAITKGNGSIPLHSSNSSYSKKEVLSSPFHTANPVEVTIDGYLSANATCDMNPTSTGSNGDNLVMANKASITLKYYIRTYNSSSCTHCIDSTHIISLSANADGMPTLDGTYPNISQSKQLEVTNVKAIVPVGGYHRLELDISQQAINGCSSGAFGYIPGNSNSKTTTGTYSTDYYVSRFFNNGFLLGTRSNNYILAYKNGSSMELVMENNGHGFKFSAAGLQYKKNGGSWTPLV